METASMKAISTARLFVRALALLALIMFAVPPGAAQERASGEVKQIASDLYFYYDADGGANAAFLVTEEGVLLIDTLTHPRLARDLLDRIRKVTDKPVKWVITERTIAPRLPSRQVLRGSAGPLAANVDDVRLSGKAVEVDRWNWSGLQKASPIFFATTSPPSDVVDETGAKSAVVEDKATATADVEFDQATQVNVISTIPPDQQEIQRRRELVRALFNDFWNGSDDKPVTFVDRLNQAEPYLLNERLTACGESWQLDANTRKLLGLPPRAN